MRSVDTRVKIKNWPDTAELIRSLTSDASKGVVVTGFFDPLLAEHARRLEEIAAVRGRVVVALNDAPAALLPARTRAELLAGLRAVDTVLLPPPTGLQTRLAALPRGLVIREEGSDERRREDLIRRVRQKHGL